MLKKIILSICLLLSFSLINTNVIYGTQSIEPISGEVEATDGETGQPAFCDPNEENGECPLIFDDTNQNTGFGRREFTLLAGVTLLVGAALISILERIKHKR